MCDYCGCDSTEALAELYYEHRALEDSAARLRLALEQDEEARARDLFARITEILGPHVRKGGRGTTAAG